MGEDIESGGDIGEGDSQQSDSGMSKALGDGEREKAVFSGVQSIEESEEEDVGWHSIILAGSTLGDRKGDTGVDQSSDAASLVTVVTVSSGDEVMEVRPQGVAHRSPS